MSRPLKNLSVETADRLLRCPWPGNVRELENAMKRSVALSEGSRIELVDLPEEVRRTLTAPPPRAWDERALASLEKNGGNHARTSAQLKIGSATLYRKLKSYGVVVAR
jgi:transcriptional regulator of acetoin/glycerol metabolism